jgi:L-amino acid N-acyltransferase YncA
VDEYWLRNHFLTTRQLSDYSQAMIEPATESSTTFAVRPMAPDDARGFSLFVSQVPEGERRFLKENLDDPVAAFATFLNDPHSRRVVAIEHGTDVVGVAGVFPGSGWSSHVAELRVLVAATHRGRGRGRVLAQSALLEALKLGCTHTYVEVVAEQEALVAMFQDLGFEPQALLTDFVRDGAGDFHDLMILTHRADDQWGRNQLLGLTEVDA